ncbi:hypothetical protein BZA77DRAFT_103554 [Pyronema omphalodes]|nr:hypothetical protein BZA77DRAFT_103554 [Pyronema omphalodes]
MMKTHSSSTFLFLPLCISCIFSIFCSSCYSCYSRFSYFSSSSDRRDHQRISVLTETDSKARTVHRDSRPPHQV